MTKEEFLAKAQADPEWAPGWEAIDEVFGTLYPGQKPAHYASASRARFGGSSWLDGVSVYRSPKGYCHLVTYGLSELYAEPAAFGGEWSRWGYEMTFKLRAREPADCLWAVNMLDNLARYTCTTRSFFEPWQYIAGGGPICQGSSTALTSLITVPDTEARGRDTLFGRLEFIQLVGITQAEFDAIGGSTENLRALARRLRELSPDWVTDLDRK